MCWYWRRKNKVSDVHMEYLIRDRLSWLRFPGFDFGAPTPDADTIRMFRERPTAAGARATPQAAFDRPLKERGQQTKSGQIVHEPPEAAPTPRNLSNGRPAGSARVR